MKKDQKSLIWRSTYKVPLEKSIADKFGNLKLEIVGMLWRAYRVKEMLESPYFEFIRLGDHRLTLVVQKYVDGTFKVEIITH